MGSSNQVLDQNGSDGKFGSPRQHDKDFRGPIHDRGCTDVLCLLLLIAFVVGWVVVGVFAFSWGNPLILIYPSNSNGEICGQGENSEKPVLLFYDITRCISLESAIKFACPTKQVCVKDCPQTTSLLTEKNRETFTPFCSSEFNNGMTVVDAVKGQVCPQWIMKSKPILGRCVPSITSDEFENSDINGNGTDVTWDKLKKGVENLANLLGLRDVGTKVFNDLKTQWWTILIGLIISCAVSLLWIVLMRWVAKVMVWISLFLSIGLLVVGCVYCGYKYNEITEVTGGDTKDAVDDLISVGFTTNLDAYLSLSITWMVFLVLMAIALLIILIIVIFLRKRIKIAIELIEEGSIAVGHMFSTLFFPLVPFIWELLVIVWFFAVAVFLASSGVPEYTTDLEGQDSCNINGTIYEENQKCEPDNFPNMTSDPDGPCPNAACMFYKYGPPPAATYMQIYNLFGLLWMLFFFSAMGEMVLAGAFASWYWTLDKRDTPTLPLLSSFGRVLRYHLGTLAFGALIIAIIRMIRIIIEYVEKKLKEYHQENPLVKVCFCCCKCCLWCLEKFMKFINRNAYIMTAVYGKNFCWSAKEAFTLLMRNILRVFILDNVCDFLLLLGKLVIVGSVGVLSFYTFSGKIGAVEDELPEMNYYFVPVIIITLGAYFIADVFFGVYEMAVDTLFLCFLEDIERNDGSEEKPYYMSRDLKKILNFKNDKSRDSSATSR